MSAADAEQAARAALAVLGGHDGALGGLSLVGTELSLTPDEEVAALMALEAAPLPERAPRERARAGGAALALLGLVVVAVFVALPLQVALGAALGTVAPGSVTLGTVTLASALAVAVVVVLAVALRGLLGRVCASVPLRARTTVPTGLRRGRRRAGGRRGAHVLVYDDQDPAEG